MQNSTVQKIPSQYSRSPWVILKPNEDGTIADLTIFANTDIEERLIHKMLSKLFRPIREDEKHILEKVA